MRRDPREDRLRESVRSLRVPGEDEALERAVATAASGAVTPARRGRGRSIRAAVAAVAAVGLGAVLVLTPAGADVREWVADAIDDEPVVEKEALTRLPAAGEVLVTSDRGAWLVAGDGSRRLLGDYDQATFSPRGLYIGATRGNTLTAVEPSGEVRWSISRPFDLADPRWAPSGYRIAYREGRGLGVIAGDGTLPHLVARDVAPVAPSWRPPPDGTDPRSEPNVLTYVAGNGLITTVDADSGRELWHRTSSRRPISVTWSGPDRLVVATVNGVRVLDRDGELVTSPPLPAASTVESVTPSPGGERLAIVLGERGVALDARSRLYLARIAGGEPRERTVFSGFGRFGEPTFSPDGEWILMPWKDTDQWLFISPSEDRKLLRRVVAVGDIGRQFDPGGRGRGSAPAIEGWCCP